MGVGELQRFCMYFHVRRSRVCPKAIQTGRMLTANMDGCQTMSTAMFIITALRLFQNPWKTLDRCLRVEVKNDKESNFQRVLCSMHFSERTYDLFWELCQVWTR